MVLGTDHLVICVCMWGGGCGGGRRGAGFLSKKNILVLDMQEKKMKRLKRGTKKIIWLQKYWEKNILDPYDGNDSILFDIYKCCWLPPDPLFHI